MKEAPRNPEPPYKLRLHEDSPDTLKYAVTERETGFEAPYCHLSGRIYLPSRYVSEVETSKVIDGVLDRL